MICVIRITGDVNLKGDVRETLKRLRMHRKYSCVVLKGTPVELGMVKKLRDYVAFGEISEEVLEKLIKARVQPLDKSKKIDTKVIAQGLVKGTAPKELGIKPFFRLHPPLKGIDAKKHVGVKKGVLGDHKDKLHLLLERML